MKRMQGYYIVKEVKDGQVEANVITAVMQATVRVPFWMELHGPYKHLRDATHCMVQMRKELAHNPWIRSAYDKTNENLPGAAGRLEGGKDEFSL